MLKILECAHCKNGNFTVSEEDFRDAGFSVNCEYCDNPCQVICDVIVTIEVKDANGVVVTKVSQERQYLEKQLYSFALGGKLYDITAHFYSVVKAASKAFTYTLRGWSQ